MRAAGSTISAGELREGIAHLADDEPMYVALGQDAARITGVDARLIELDIDPYQDNEDERALLFRIANEPLTKAAILELVKPYAQN